MWWSRLAAAGRVSLASRLESSSSLIRNCLQISSGFRFPSLSRGLATYSRLQNQARQIVTKKRSTEVPGKPKAPEPEAETRDYFMEAAELIVSTFKFAFLYGTIELFLFETTMTLGPSMLPTLSVGGDVILVDKRRNFYPFSAAPLAKGDVVIATSPHVTKHLVCKRVMAVEGETSSTGVFVPKGCVWLEGDNPNNSDDSRHYGPISLSTIKGKVVWKLYPKFGPLDPRPEKPAAANEENEEMCVKYLRYELEQLERAALEGSAR